MRYMLLIYSEESGYQTMSEEDMGRIMAGYEAFGKEIEEAGVFLHSDRLQPVMASTTVRIRNGETLSTDGPFAETKEQLGGYYMIDVADLDEALRWAQKIPTAKYGSVEVRPVWEM